MRAVGALCREVEKVAGLAGVMLRTGCFCNPGACAAHLGLSHQDVISNFEAGHVCWDDHDLIEGRPTGNLMSAVPVELLKNVLKCTSSLGNRP